MVHNKLTIDSSLMARKFGPKVDQEEAKQSKENHMEYVAWATLDHAPV